MSGAPRTTPSAPNVLFLIGFGMFLTIAVLPALLSALVRLFVILALLATAAAASNPSDHSFACWISEQENVRMKENPSVKQWFSAVVKTAIALVSNEQLTWTYYNIIVCSVVYVPTLQRYAFGCCGSWWWADMYPKLLELCKAKWIKSFTKGGVESGIEQYLVDSTRMIRRASGNTGIGGVRRRHVGEMEDAATAFTSALGDLAATFQSPISNPAHGSVSTGSDRQIRAKAIQAKINKEWRVAAKYFMEASTLASTLRSRTNYRLEAAWCDLEELKTFPTSKSKVMKLTEDVCEDLASAGYFEDAARALSDLALRLKRKFLQDCNASDNVSMDIANLYLRAKTMAEAGNNGHAACENVLRAAVIYCNVSLWQLAEECYDMAGRMQLNASQVVLANGSFGNALLCRIGQLDIIGARQQAHDYTKLQREYSGDLESSVLDALLESVFTAYDKWSTVLLQNAIRQYELKSSLIPWQRQCLVNVQEKMNNGDLR